MTRLFALIAAILGLYSANAQATPLLADLSQYRIDMDSSFNGTRIFMFGVRNDPGDIVMVVRGPERDFIVRKKESIGGVWINRDRMKFFGVPEFYAIAASRPLKEIEQDSLFRRLGIGQEMLFYPPADPAKLDKFKEYSDAFLNLQQKKKLYVRFPADIQFMGETLFKTTVDFPDNIPPGNYTAEFYLLNDGEISGMQSMPITVSKSGLDAFLYTYAHKSPALYGITAIVLALCAGWFAGRIYEKI